MLLVLFLIFVVTPIVELAVIIQVAGSTGVMNTIGLLILVSLVGAWLVRREGLGILRRAQAELAKGRMPGRELVCLLYTSPSPRDKRQSRMPSSA